MKGISTRIGLFALSALLLGFVPKAEEKMYYGKGNVSFLSSAPLETITAASNELQGVLNLTKSSFAFTFPIISFEGFNSLLQKEHFHENYMETTKYPKATFTGNILNFEDCPGTCEQEIVAKGVLNIHGTSKVVTIPVQLKKEGEVLSAKTDFKVLLADFDIEIPLILEGKIAPEINVSVDIDFERKGGQN